MFSLKTETIYNRELLIFPNPASVNTPQWILEGWREEDFGSKLNLVLYDTRGRKLLQQEPIVEQQVRLRIEGGLPPGVYLLQAVGQQGTYTGKLIVQ